VLINGPAVDAPVATHAFIVGVSHYPYADGRHATADGEQSGIQNLTSAARSASEVAEWLLREYSNPDAPLADVSILLSPVEGEAINPHIEKLMGDTRSPATRDAVETAFIKFKRTCRQNPNNVAFVYVAGHGVQINNRGAILLLEDFAVEDREYLYGSIDVVGCHAAMDTPGHPERQLWFSDACRQRPNIARKFETLSGYFTPSVEPGQVDAAPLFLAAGSRDYAFAEVGGCTIFSTALLTALRGAAAIGPTIGRCDQWHVSAARLAYYLPHKVDELLAGREKQRVDSWRIGSDVIAQRFDDPPGVEIVVHLNPPDAQPVPVATLLFKGLDPRQVDPTWPLRYRGDPGLYELKVDVDPPLTKGVPKMLISAFPPGCEEHVEVS
jgi:hypothetical protein